ncbi:MAG: YicC family protein [Clostridia bacterium]|nr:YicC family protein [Clostridia bacterium]
MNSMTGYGRASAEIDGRTLTVELKSVNHRFLDISLRMPRSFAFLEDDVRKWIGARLARGHVDLFASYRNLRNDAKTVTVDSALLKGYQQALSEVARLTGTPDQPSQMDFARLPDILLVTEAEEDQEALRELMKSALSQALDQMAEMRAREGASLREDILSRLAALEAYGERIALRNPDMVQAYQERLEKRLRELLEDRVDEQRLLQEVAIMADKSAIDEETVRLKSHIEQARDILGGTEPAGRKLDFLVQELNREVNTISSKSLDVPITQIVVSAKAEIEKIREQVQNIE